MAVAQFEAFDRYWHSNAPAPRFAAAVVPSSHVGPPHVLRSHAWHAPPPGSVPALHVGAGGPPLHGQRLSASQAAPFAHVPQFATLRACPQLSVPLFEPQSAPTRVQNAAFDSGVHPHCFGVPPPPQVTPVPEQVPQLGTVRA